MVTGEEAYVAPSAVVTSEKQQRVFVRWRASLVDAPDNASGRFSPLILRRLKRGFSLTVRPGDEFRTSPLPWGEYAPVIELVQFETTGVSDVK